MKLCLRSRWGRSCQIQNLKAGASNSNPKGTPDNRKRHGLRTVAFISAINPSPQFKVTTTSFPAVATQFAKNKKTMSATTFNPKLSLPPMLPLVMVAARHAGRSFVCLREACVAVRWVDRAVNIWLLPCSTNDEIPD